MQLKKNNGIHDTSLSIFLQGLNCVIRDQQQRFNILDVYFKSRLNAKFHKLNYSRTQGTWLGRGVESLHSLSRALKGCLKQNGFDVPIPCGLSYIYLKDKQFHMGGCRGKSMGACLPAWELEGQPLHGDPPLCYRQCTYHTRNQGQPCQRSPHNPQTRLTLKH